MNHLGLFAKFWQPGTVKTRLAVTIGNANACNLYRTFLFHLLTRLGKTADQRSVVFTPTKKRDDFRAAISLDWQLYPQHDGDLGDRMNDFFHTCFSSHNEVKEATESDTKVVVIGADCPLLSPATINEAYDALEHSPIALGPSHDGGYYLLGMRENCKEIFTNVAWSTPHVLSQSIAQLKLADKDYHLLAPMSDVDEIDDLMKLQSDLDSRVDDLDSYDLELLNQIHAATSPRFKESQE